ncbi:MAG: hypothetical protein ACRYFU_11570 [Janthinobacterium lividum]
MVQAPASRGAFKGWRHIYTNDAAALGQKLSHDASKSSAIDFRQQQPSPPQKREDKTMDVEAQQAQTPEQATREIIYRQQTTHGTMHR